MTVVLFLSVFVIFMVTSCFRVSLKDAKNGQAVYGLKDLIRCKKKNKGPEIKNNEAPLALSDGEGNITEEEGEEEEDMDVEIEVEGEEQEELYTSDLEDLKAEESDSDSECLGDESFKKKELELLEKLLAESKKEKPKWLKKKLNDYGDDIEKLNKR